MIFNSNYTSVNSAKICAMMCIIFKLDNVLFPFYFYITLVLYLKYQSVCFSNFYM